MLHTLSDVIYAHNAGLDLFNLVLDYLRDWAIHANGTNNVTVKYNEIAHVRFHGISGTPDSPGIKVSVCSHVEYVAYDIFIEDEVSDYEGYGRPGHYEQSGHQDRVYTEITIPISLLLDSKQERINKMCTLQKN